MPLFWSKDAAVPEDVLETIELQGECELFIS
jgi:hypothetical protein